jgi:hypothetical protein
MTADTTEPKDTAAPTPVAPDRWFLSDCEGQLVILREDKLRNVTRDERGEITGYRLPAEWGPDVVIAEWDLNTWDEGDDESDDLRRETAARIVADHNEVERLRAALGAEVRRNSGGRTVPSGAPDSVVRSWAREHNIPTNPKGRVAPDVRAAYEAAWRAEQDGGDPC